MIVIPIPVLGLISPAKLIKRRIRACCSTVYTYIRNLYISKEVVIMNSAGIILFFSLATFIGIAGLILAGAGVRRLQQEFAAHLGASKNTMFRHYGVDLVITFVGLGLISIVAFNLYRIVLG